MIADLLRAEGLSKSFGGIAAVRDVSIRVAPGQLVGLIGPNGAGKTTMMRLLAGLLPPTRGRIFMRDRDVTGLPTHLRVGQGLALTHQIVRPLLGMTVLENVLVAAGRAATKSAVRSLFRYRRADERRRALEILDLLGLKADADELPDVLPLGKLKRLQVARALALRPELLLLDEPLAGLNQREATTLADLIRDLHGGGLTIVLVEHNLAEVVRIAERLVVFDNGAVIADGDPDAVMRLAEVQEAYVGRGEPARA